MSPMIVAEIFVLNSKGESYFNKQAQFKSLIIEEKINAFPSARLLVTSYAFTVLKNTQLRIIALLLDRKFKIEFELFVTKVELDKGNMILEGLMTRGENIYHLESMYLGNDTKSALKALGFSQKYQSDYNLNQDFYCLSESRLHALERILKATDSDKSYCIDRDSIKLVDAFSAEYSKSGEFVVGKVDKTYLIDPYNNRDYYLFHNKDVLFPYVPRPRKFRSVYDPENSNINENALAGTLGFVSYLMTLGAGANLSFLIQKCEPFIKYVIKDNVFLEKLYDKVCDKLLLRSDLEEFLTDVNVSDTFKNDLLASYDDASDISATESIKLLKDLGTFLIKNAIPMMNLEKNEVKIANGLRRLLYYFFVDSVNQDNETKNWLRKLKAPISDQTEGISDGLSDENGDILYWNNEITSKAYYKSERFHSSILYDKLTQYFEYGPFHGNLVRFNQYKYGTELRALSSIDNYIDIRLGDRVKIPLELEKTVTFDGFYITKLVTTITNTIKMDFEIGCYVTQLLDIENCRFDNWKEIIKNYREDSRKIASNLV